MTIRRDHVTFPLGNLYVLTGETTPEELIGISDELRAEKDIVFAILDFTNASLKKLSLPDLHRIAIKDTSFPSTHSFKKLALVGLTGKGLWLAETYKFFTEKWIQKNNYYETKILDRIDEAKHWVGIRPQDN